MKSLVRFVYYNISSATLKASRYRGADEGITHKTIPTPGFNGLKFSPHYHTAINTILLGKSTQDIKGLVYLLAT